VRLAKLLVAVYCAAALGLEAHAVFSTTKYNNRRWPFVNYPMYSTSHKAGETTTITRLKAVPCDAPTAAVELGPGDLRLINNAFERLVQQAGSLRRATPVETQQAQEKIAQLVRSRPGAPLCALQVWTRSMRVGEAGGEEPTPWEVKAEWKALAEAGR
jgi:hypothetical protein